jgi:hypothetical protein
MRLLVSFRTCTGRSEKKLKRARCKELVNGSPVRSGRTMSVLTGERSPSRRVGYQHPRHCRGLPAAAWGSRNHRAGRSEPKHRDPAV